MASHTKVSFYIFERLKNHRRIIFRHLGTWRETQISVSRDEILLDSNRAPSFMCHFTHFCVSTVEPSIGDRDHLALKAGNVPLSGPLQRETFVLLYYTEPLPFRNFFNFLKLG